MSEADEFLDNCTHALVAISADDLDSNNPYKICLHVVAFQSEPSELDVEEIYRELAIDQALGMTDLVPREDYRLVTMMWKDIASQL